MQTSGSTKAPFDISSRVEGLRILVIDDDPAKLDALASSLRLMGASVSVGGRGKSGYTQASLSIPDVIISDLISPGEPGWHLVQDIRRHPVLRWTPFLLLNWWEKDDQGHGRVLTDRLLERLEEVLAPFYVIEERRRTNRPLGGHVSSIGPLAMLRLLVKGNLIGTLTVNDGWSVFEAKIKKDAVHSIKRVGVAGFNDEGSDAFTQLLLCDSGRWSFRPGKGSLEPANIESDLEHALSRTSSKLADLFNRGLQEKRVEMPIRARLGILDSSESALPMVAGRIAELLERNADNDEFDILINEVDSPPDLERALRMLVRVGVVTPMDSRDGLEHKPEDKASSERALLLFNSLEPALSISKRNQQPRSIERETRSTDERSEDLRYSDNAPLSEIEEPSGKTVDLEDMNSPSIQAERNHRAAKKPLGPRISTALSTAVSTILSTIMLLGPKHMVAKQTKKPETDTFQMWVAVAITLIFGALVVAGLFAIASDDDSPDPIENADEDR